MNLEPFIFGTALLLGLRHGVDFDHIAAIADISGSSDNPFKGFVHGMIYALGHAFVVIALGFLAISLGLQLPAWVNNFMEPLVGVTLIILGIWLIYAIGKYKKNFKMISRWKLLMQGITTVQLFVHKKLSHKHPHVDKKSIDEFGARSAFAIGMVHGIGAETPTQILIFLAAAKIGGGTVGSLILITFVIGLLISNTMITTLSVFGFTNAKKYPRLSLAFGSLVAVFSIVLGGIFLFGG